MRFYRTREENLLNLDQVTVIYRDPDDGGYRVSFTNGLTYEMPEIEGEDIDSIMEYNNHLIDL